MRAIAPDAVASAADEQVLRQRLAAQLRRVDAPSVDTENAGPGLFAAARDGESAGVERAVLEDAVDANHALSLHGWPIELPHRGAHLDGCLDRVLKQLAGTPGAPTVDVRVSPWHAADREVLSTGVDALAQAWPEMLAELRTSVRQVVKLDGRGIVGFTDFAAHGAVFIGARRLCEADGLTGALRLAESLVHEGTHSRCNAASVVEPFLTGDAAGGRLVSTPLRTDPRPLSGLFQQLVVLIRCAEMHRRLVECRCGTPEGSGATAKLLFGQADDAARTLRAHEDALTEAGRAVLSDAESILRSGVR